MSEFLCPPHNQLGRAPMTRYTSIPCERIREGEGEGAFYLSKPFFHDDPLQDMCKWCYDVYG